MLYPEQVFKVATAEPKEHVELNHGYIHCKLRVFAKEGESQLIFGQGGICFMLVTELKPGVYRYNDCVFFYENKVPNKFNHKFESLHSEKIEFEGKTHDEVALAMRIRIYNLGSSVL